MRLALAAFTIPMLLPMTGCDASAGSTTALEKSPAGLEQVRLTIASARAKHEFVVEVAATPAQQQYGLMNREEMAADHGMIFPFEDGPRLASFWMKNTLIPLDMIFVRADGTIANIAAETVPLSLEPVYSDGNVAAVLEINGGRAAELGIKAGDKVSWPH